MIFWYLRTSQTSCNFHLGSSHVVVCVETSVGCHFATNLKQLSTKTFFQESWLFYWNIWIDGSGAIRNVNAHMYLESLFANETVYVVLFPNFLIPQFFFWYKLTSPTTHHWTNTKYSLSWSSRLPFGTNSCRIQGSFVWVSLYGMLNCCLPFYDLKNIFQITKTSNHLYWTWILS